MSWNPGDFRFFEKQWSLPEGIIYSKNKDFIFDLEYFFITIHFAADKDKPELIENFINTINEILLIVIISDDIIKVYQETKILYLCLVCLYSMYFREIDFSSGELFDNIIKQFFDVSSKITQKVRQLF